MITASSPHPSVPYSKSFPQSQQIYASLPIPSQLLADLQNNLTAIGMYALVARLTLIAQAPVPLSVADAQQYDPALTRGSGVRALARLVEGGWLLEEATPGRKSRYTPTWGRVDGEARPWQLGTGRLGRPSHRAAVRLDKRLLDVYLGRLVPHPDHPAAVERYLTHPLLSLADVGAYARALVAPCSTEALLRLGLVQNEQARSLPDDSAILALASQQCLFQPDAPVLNERGLRCLGIDAVPRRTSGVPLLFMPLKVIEESIGGVIGGVIGGMIGQGAQGDQQGIASGRAESAVHFGRGPCTRIVGEQGKHGDPPPSPPASLGPGGGFTNILSHHGPDSAASPEIPETSSSDHTANAAGSNPTIQLLRSLGIRPAVVTELASVPVETVQAAIAHGRERPHVRDIAGWVVSALRSARAHGWQIPSSASSPAASETPPRGGLPPDLAALHVEATLARALTAAGTPDSAPETLPADDACCCDGSGTYLLPVPYEHPQWGKVQRCPCSHRGLVVASLARTAGPELAAAELANLRIADRPYHDVSWGGRAFTSDEQLVLLRHALARAVASASASSERGACLLGPPGSGKTTLAVAAAKELATRRGLALRYANTPQMLDELRREAADHMPAALLRQLVDVPVLVLDDLGREQLTKWAREKLYRLLDERMRAHTPDTPRITFVTSNRSFAELYAQDAALASRIAAHTEVLLCVTSDYRLHADGRAR